MRKSALLLLAGLLAVPSYSVFADAITDAASSEFRSAKAQARDEYRHPQQTLRFFDVQPNMTVVEISPGGGWYTDILAPLLKDHGKLIAAHFFVDEESGNYYRRSLAGFKKKIAEHPPYKNIALSAFDPVKALNITTPNSADRVLTFRNVHNWYMNGKDKGVVNAMEAFFNALKPGGILGLVDHRLPESASDDKMASTGYMKQSYVIAMAQKAGFTLVATSDVNANPLDSADHPRGVWTLPPTLSLGEENQAHYLAIGESDRMTLKFMKPE